MPLYEEIVKDFPVEYVAGGSVQNSVRVCQWMLGKQPATVMMGCTGAGGTCAGGVVTASCRHGQERQDPARGGREERRARGVRGGRNHTHRCTACPGPTASCLCRGLRGAGHGQRPHAGCEHCCGEQLQGGAHQAAGGDRCACGYKLTVNRATGPLWSVRSTSTSRASS